MVLIVALAVRLAAGCWWQSGLEGRFGFGDSQSYWTLGRTIAEGGPYQYGSADAQVFRTPGYPLLLAPIFCLAGDEPPVFWARVLSAVLGVLAVGGVWCLARQLFDARAALVAAGMAAVYPGAVATAALVLSEAPFCPLVLAHLILWTAAWNTRSSGRTEILAFAAGVAAGAAVLVRPSWLLFTPFALAIGLAASGERKRQLGIGAVILAGLIVTMMPWWVRNARLTSRLVPTTLQVGASLYDGLNPQATGASNMDPVPESVRELRRRAAAGDVERDVALEIEVDRQFRAAAWSFARDNPAKVARLAAVKLARMWNFWPNEPTLSTWPIRLAVLLTYVPVLVLGVVGAARTIRRGWPYLLCWLPAVYFTLLHVVFVSSIRYRQPAMLGLMVLAAGVVVSRRATDAPDGPTGGDAAERNPRLPAATD